ncbi:transmembrane signal receptor [Lithospermum erythrorhizon]|uniref:Transmembrane signal receptor n=1 Tax=Lithospermum erythrorhizon TaxID=34254 RepID=A0AAV3P6A6_LITER
MHSTSGFGLILHGDMKLSLQAYSDSDWASCPTTRRSTTGYVITLDNSPISWKSKKQSTVSRSSAEVEYRAMTQAFSEVTWLVRLLADLGVKDLCRVTLNCDNNLTLHIAQNSVFHERTKHIDIDCHFRRDKVLEGLLILSHLPTNEQVGDILTKILPSHQHEYIVSKLGLLRSSQSPTCGGVMSTSNATWDPA